MPSSRFIGVPITRELNVELLPCPFCGENGRVIAREIYPDPILQMPGTGPKYRIGCEKCGASQPRTRWLKTAIMKWNERNAA